MSSQADISQSRRSATRWFIEYMGPMNAIGDDPTTTTWKRYSPRRNRTVSTPVDGFDPYDALTLADALVWITKERGADARHALQYHYRLIGEETDQILML